MKGKSCRCGSSGQPQTRQHRSVEKGGPREENAEKKRRTLGGLTEGRSSGSGENITEYGASSIWGNRRILHQTDMSWDVVNHPSEMFNRRSRGRVVVLKFDPEKGARLPGIKQRASIHGRSVDEKYPRESRVRERS